MTASPPTAAATLRIAAAALLAAKKEAGDTAPTTRPAAADAGAVAAITLKAAVSALADAAEAARASASAACEAADAGGLALQTLLYEARHYDREIEACWAFRSAYTDADIDLVPEPDFWASAAPELTAAAKAGGPHALMVARLEHERAGRAAAVAGLASARTANEALERTVAAKRRFLNDLQADLAAVAGAVEPLRARLRLAPPAVSGGSALAHADAAAAILPGPLHLAYALLAGCAQAYPELGVSVGFAAAAAVEGGGGRGRRPSTAGGAAGEPPAVAASSAIADPAPPLVTLTFSGGEAAEEGEGEPPTSPPHPPFTLALRWLPGLRLLSAGPLRPGGGGGGDVGAAATAAAAALRAAFPGDDGASPPSEAASQLLAAGGTADAAAAFAAAFPSTRPDRPSRWVQLLGGLDLRPPAEAGGEAATLPPGALGLMRSQQRAYSVLAALRESC